MTAVVGRAARILLAVALGIGWRLAPGATELAAAADCSVVYCGTISLSLGGGADGHVTSDPTGLDCSYSPLSGSQSGTCSYQFTWGHFAGSTTAVDIYLSPDARGYVCPPSQSCGELGETRKVTVSLSNGQTINAGYVFNPAKHVTVTLDVSGDGAGKITTSPAGIDCSYANGVTAGTCATSAAYATTWTIAFTSDANRLSHVCVPGSSCAAIGAAQTVEYIGNINSFTFTVSLALVHPILTVSKTGSGTIRSQPTGITCGTTCSSHFDTGTKVTLTATPASGYSFAGWTGACSGVSSRTCAITMGSSDVSTSATFKKIPAPTPTPRPTVRPTSKPSTRPTSPPTAAPPAAPVAPTASPAEAPSPPTPSGPPPSANVSPDAAASTAPGTTVTPTRAGLPSGSSEAEGGIESPLALGMLTVIVLLVLVVGYLLGSRRRTREA